MRLPAQRGSETANYRVLAVKNDKLVIRDFYSSDYSSPLPITKNVQSLIGRCDQHDKNAFEAARNFVDTSDVTSGIVCDPKGQIVHGSLSVKDAQITQQLLVPLSR
ncbi:hypothetical protein KC711_04520, partial [Candidatus Peregrinibacteria bacterium]|nr:hypothetical protein [Candidatus Peregrinibacteria bacterium]